ncbi:MAG: T9SS type A sorting domain-containing protein [Bacteroidota bacterium]
MRLWRIAPAAAFLMAAVLLSLTPAASAQWDADAGLVASHTDGAAVAATSTTGNGLPDVNDGDPATQWQSGACFPSGFIGRADTNVLLGTCADGNCTSSSTGSLNGATRGGPGSVGVQAVGGRAWLRADLAQPSDLYRIAVRLGTGSSVTLSAVTAADTTLVATLTSSDNYGWNRYAVPALSGPVVGVLVESAASFSLFEVAALAEACFEAVTFDFGATQEVGIVEGRVWTASGVTATVYQTSADSLTWTTVATIDPTVNNMITTKLAQPVQARYFRVRHTMADQNWAKAYVWEIDAYDRWNRYGPPQAFTTPTAQTLGDLLGINGVWGWGTGSYSDALATGEGPDRYTPVASHVRNYHNLNWDLNDPDDTPDFSNMATSGTPAKWWLDWDREYGDWQAAGLDVRASIQFVQFDASDWDTPFASAQAYGDAFAAHFGPTSGTGDVSAMEVGNEPWIDWPVATYRDVLRGMASGAKAADPAMVILPAAFQAYELEQPGDPYKNYLGARVTAAEAPYIDALNAHLYSFTENTAGTRIATRPENPASKIYAIRNMARWRDTNMPGTPIHVTEWGWDSSGAGESCTFGECVSEVAQARYGVRGALILAREGAETLTWYFYANTSGGTLFTRSGLTGSAATSYAAKRSYVAFQAFQATLGDRHLVDVLREDDTAYAYLLGEADGTPTHLVAWRPVDGDDATTVPTTLTVNAVPDSAWTLDGISATGEAATTPTAVGSAWAMDLGAAPLVVAFDTTAAPPGAARALPATFTLETPYPNPVADAATVRFTAPQSAPVRVDLYDALGRRVRTLYDATPDFGETVTLRLDTAGLAGGLYVLRALSPDGPHTARLTIIR